MTQTSNAARLCVLVGVVMLTAACTLKMTYNYADWLALWQIDHYFDLTPSQKEFLSDRLQLALAHHREQSLPKYERVVVKAREKLQRGLTDEDVDWFFAVYEELRDDLFDLFVADGTHFLTSVDRRQIRYLERAFSESNEELGSQLEENTQARVTKRAAATVEWLEDWLGPLSTKQEDQIRQLSLALPDTLEVWLEYRQQRQQAFVRVVSAAQNDGADEIHLREWLLLPYKDAPPQYLKAREQMRAGVKRMALAIDRMMTPTQRGHLVDALQELIDDLHDLSTS